MVASTAPLQMQSQQGLSEHGSAGASESVWQWAQHTHPPEGAAVPSPIDICSMQLKGQTARLASIDRISSQ